jgi:hypothetical protein
VAASLVSNTVAVTVLPATPDQRALRTIAKNLRASAQVLERHVDAAVRARIRGLLRRDADLLEDIAGGP